MDFDVLTEIFRYVDLSISWKFKKYIDFDYIARIDEKGILDVIKQGHLEIVEYLLEKESFSGNRYTEMSIAIQYGHLNIVEYLFEKCFTICFNEQFLRSSIRYGNLDIFQFIFGMCTEEYLDYAIDEILHHAIYFGHLALVEFLNETIECGTEELCIAIRMEYLEIVQYIIEKRDKLFFWDTKREILEEANNCGNLAMIEILNEFFTESIQGNL
jgi:hypothetical protein